MRLTASQLERLALEARTRDLAVARLREDRGCTLSDLARWLELPGGVGVHAIVRQLIDRDLAHVRGELVYQGPSPARAAEVNVKMQDRVLGVLREHPHSRAGDIADRAQLPVTTVSNALRGLRLAGQVHCTGARSQARWSCVPRPAGQPYNSEAGFGVSAPTAATPPVGDGPPPRPRRGRPPKQRPTETPPDVGPTPPDVVSVDDLAALDTVLDEFVPAHPLRLYRIAMLHGLVRHALRP